MAGFIYWAQAMAVFEPSRKVVFVCAMDELLSVGRFLLGAPPAEVTSNHEGVGTPTISATFPVPVDVMESSHTAARTGPCDCYKPRHKMLELATAGATSCWRRCWNLQQEELQPVISFAATNKLEAGTGVFF